jgi:hypothetical protein
MLSQLLGDPEEEEEEESKRRSEKERPREMRVMGAGTKQ